MDKLEELQKKYDELYRQNWFMVHSINGNINGLALSRLLDLSEDDQTPDQIKKKIKLAIRGIETIGKMTSSSFFAIEGSEQDFLLDLNSEEGITFEELILHSLVNSVFQLFDTTRHCKVTSAYWPSKEDYSTARTGWKSSFKSNLNELLTFIEEALKIKVTLTIDSKIKVGSDHKSSDRLIVLLEELFINALTQLSEEKERVLNITVREELNKLNVSINNTCTHRSSHKGSGLGSNIINQIVTIVKGELMSEIKDDMFNKHIQFLLS